MRLDGGIPGLDVLANFTFKELAVADDCKESIISCVGTVAAVACL
jgi:hypothetical protein